VATYTPTLQTQQRKTQQAPQEKAALTNTQGHTHIRPMCGNEYIDHIYIESWLRDITNRRKMLGGKFEKNKRKYFYFKMLLVSVNLTLRPTMRSTPFVRL
jgi:hypothetical protein